MTDERANENAEADESAVETATEERPQYGVGPFSVREVALIGVWLVAFVVSFFSVASEQAMAQLLFGGSVWTNGLDWILTIGLPTVAVFLIVLRRFSPDGIRRFGSLGIDQFASVAFSVSAVVWLTLLWRNVVVAAESSVWIYGWVVWVEFFLMLAGVVLTVFAPFIPPFAEDFAGRREVVAHRNARPIRPVTARPPRPVAEKRTDETAAFETGSYDLTAGPDQQGAYGQGPYGQGQYGQGAAVYGQASQNDTYPVPAYDDRAGGRGGDRSGDRVAAVDQADWAPDQTRDTFERVDATAHASQQSHQAFWALVPEERDIVDDRGVPIFRIGPTAWALVLEDRGEAFVVRSEDGRVGYLHDVSGVTRG